MSKWYKMIVEVNSIDMTTKDIINIKSKDDFFEINKMMFPGGTIIFDLKGTFYLIGTDVVYTYNNGKKKKV